MGIPVCIQGWGTGVHAVEISTKFAYGDPRTHNEIVRIWGLTYTLDINKKIEFGHKIFWVVLSVPPLLQELAIYHSFLLEPFVKWEPMPRTQSQLPCLICRPQP